MAENIDGGEFWLPSQFLTDDDILMDFKVGNIGGKGREADGGLYFPSGFPRGFGSLGPYSGLSSPVESVGSSTETESDEEEYIAELTRKMARSTLRDDLWNQQPGLDYQSQKSWAMGGSPQSTLCSVTGGCGCNKCSSRGSPNCPSQVSSPPALKRKDAAWDLLCAAAGEVARMRMIDERSVYYQNRGGFCNLRSPSNSSVPLKNVNTHLGFPSEQSPSYQQLQIAQFQRLKQQQMMKEQGCTIWGQPKGGGGHYQQSQSEPVVENRARNIGRPMGLSASAWPTLQQSQQQQQPPPLPPPSSGMRAVFLGNPGSKRECAGTGVFLPRCVGSLTETRKKQGCSTVLLPDRVVQALNLNLEAMDGRPQLQSRYNGSFASSHDAPLKYRNDGLLAQQKRIVGAPVAMNQDFRLPSEWTY
ncbi:hypothetical protein NMG60_11000288 [Bertholletia excelsa]